MIGRRDLLIGAGCVAALGAAETLRPRKVVTLLNSRRLETIVPTAFGTWQSVDISDPLALNPGSLSAKLYNQLVVRLYTEQKTQQQLMMLLAYGEKQTDELQLHRPEVCYPAFGYTLLSNQAAQIGLPQTTGIPCRRILAEAEDRREAVVYWSRIGDSLPDSGNAQRVDRLRMAMRGVIPDGVLCRFSMGARPDAAPEWQLIDGFVVDILRAMQRDARQALVGTQRGLGLA